jgi:hypothetical protein
VGHEHIHLETDEFASQLGEPRALPVRPTDVEDDVLPFHVAQFPQARAKWFQGVCRT